MSNPINIFIIYAREDSEIKQRLLVHLNQFKGAFNTVVWHDGNIEAGQEWRPHIQSRLELTDLFVLLVSVDFMNSEFIHQVEFQHAVDRHRAKKSIVVPVIINYCQWDIDITLKGYTFNLTELQVLPTEGKPIGEWRTAEHAYNNIAAGIRVVLSTIKRNRELELFDKEEKQRIGIELNEKKITEEQIQNGEKEKIWEEISQMKRESEQKRAISEKEKQVPESEKIGSQDEQQEAPIPWEKNTSQISWVWISGIAFLLCLLASTFLIFFGKRMENLGITGNIYYIILIPLGFSAAAFLAGAMKSYASFRSNETLPYGKLNLSAPIVIFVLVVSGGFIMPGLNKNGKFDWKLRIVNKDQSTVAFNKGVVLLYIGKYTRKEDIHNGEVVFPDIPENYNNKKGIVSLQMVDDYQLSGPSDFIISNNEDLVNQIYIRRTAQSVSTNVRGSILTSKSEPAGKVLVNFSSGLATCYTDQNGDFSVTVPLPPGEKVPLKISMNGIMVFNEEVRISATTPLNLTLPKKH